MQDEPCKVGGFGLGWDSVSALPSKKSFATNTILGILELKKPFQAQTATVSAKSCTLPSCQLHRSIPNIDIDDQVYPSTACLTSYAPAADSPRVVLATIA